MHHGGCADLMLEGQLLSLFTTEGESVDAEITEISRVTHFTTIVSVNINRICHRKVFMCISWLYHYGFLEKQGEFISDTLILTWTQQYQRPFKDIQWPSHSKCLMQYGRIRMIRMDGVNRIRGTMMIKYIKIYHISGRRRSWFATSSFSLYKLS